MLSQNPQSDFDVNPKRMIDAADMILAEGAKRPQGITMEDLRMAADGHSPSGGEYTAQEIAAAMCFLFRLGFAEPKMAKRTA